MTNHTHLTTDLVRDLRERVVGHPRLMTEAADEIERLERERDEMSVLAVRDGREVERLRAALTNIRECMGGDDPSSGWSAPEDVWGIATEALNGRE